VLEYVEIRELVYSHQQSGVPTLDPVCASINVTVCMYTQVFYNIVMNAIRASASGSAVLAFAYVVRSGPGDVRFCFGVQDCGPGMDVERAAAIGIEPSQGSALAARSSFHGRAGLGLSFSKGVLQVRGRGAASSGRAMHVALPAVGAAHAVALDNDIVRRWQLDFAVAVR
jgi:signal transduction histidine kinase